MLTQKETLTSRQNPTVKKTVALCDKKERRREGLFRFDGIKLFLEALECGLAIRQVIVRENISDPLRDAVESALERGDVSLDRVCVVCDAVFEKMSEEEAKALTAEADAANREAAGLFSQP